MTFNHYYCNLKVGKSAIYLKFAFSKYMFVSKYNDNCPKEFSICNVNLDDANSLGFPHAESLYFVIFILHCGF